MAENTKHFKSCSHTPTPSTRKVDAKNSLHLVSDKACEAGIKQIRSWKMYGVGSTAWMTGGARACLNEIVEDAQALWILALLHLQLPQVIL